MAPSAVQLQTLDDGIQTVALFVGKKAARKPKGAEGIRGEDLSQTTPLPAQESEIGAGVVGDEQPTRKFFPQRLGYLREGRRTGEIGGVDARQRRYRGAEAHFWVDQSGPALGFTGRRHEDYAHLHDAVALQVTAGILEIDEGEGSAEFLRQIP